MTMEQVLLIFIAVMINFIAIMTIYTIHRDTTMMKNNFELQIASANAKRSPEIHKLPYTELLQIVNNSIDYHTSQNMEILGLANKSSEEISLVIDDMTADISTKVVLSLNPYVIECIETYITEDFLHRYIYNSVQALIVLNIEKQKGKIHQQQRKLSKQMEDKAKK